MVVLTKRSLGEILSAMELIDADSLSLVLRKQAWGLRNPLGGRYVEFVLVGVCAPVFHALPLTLWYNTHARRSYPFYMLLETSGSDEAHDLAKLEQLLEAAVEGEVVVDGAIAQDLAQGACVRACVFLVGSAHFTHRPWATRLNK